MKALAVFLTLLLAPALAWAGLFDFVAKAVVIAMLYGATILTGGGALFALALAAYGEYKSDELKRQTEEQERQAKADYNNSLTDRTITNVATEMPFVTIYGRARVGSSVVAILPSGPRDEYQHIIAIHAAHECDAFEEIYIAKKALGTLDADGFAINSPDYSWAVNTSQDNYATSWTIDTRYIAGTVVVYQRVIGEAGFDYLPIAFTQVGTTITVAEIGTYRTIYNYKYSSVRVKKHLGIPGEAADATLMAECPGKWTAASKLSNFCYTHIRLDLNQREFQGGLVGVEALLRGKKLYDPRDASTAWSQNPALVLYDYLQGDNCAIPTEDIPVDYVTAAADVCDEAINIGARYTFNGTVTSGQDQTRVITQMAQAMAGGINSTTWEMWAGKWVAPTLTLEQADIIGAVGITPGLSDADIFNGVTARFITAENDYAPTDMVPYQNATYRALDGRDLFASMEFPYTDETQRCHNLARIYVEDQRNSFTVKATFSLKAWDTKIGQRITLNASFFGFTGKVFRVVGKTYGTSGGVDLLLKEDAEEIWDLADAVVVDATPNSGLPNPFLLAAPGSLTLSSGTAELLEQNDGTVVSRIKAVWPAGATIYAAQAEIQIKRTQGADWQTAAVVDATLSVAFLAPVNDGETYDTRIRFINPYLSVQSPWAYGSPHTVIGKTAAPDAPTRVSVVGNQVYWLVSAGADLAGYKVRSITGLTPSWGAGTDLHTGFVPSIPYTLQAQLFGVQTIMVIAVDTSGNESEVAYASHDFGSAALDYVVQSYDYQANTFPGTYTDCSISGGSLVADADPDNSIYSLTDLYSQPDIYATNWLPMVWESQRFAARYNGVITFLAELQGNATVEYRLDGGGTNDLYALADVYASADLYGATPDQWSAWPGSLQVSRGQALIFRISIDGGSTRGSIDAAEAYFTMTPVRQSFGNVALAAAGTRFSPQSGSPAYDRWVEITAVPITPILDGGGAAYAQILDLSPEFGPMVQLVNTAGVPVAGRAIVEIGGLVDA